MKNEGLKKSCFCKYWWDNKLIDVYVNKLENDFVE